MVFRVEILNKTQKNVDCRQSYNPEGKNVLNGNRLVKPRLNLTHVTTPQKIEVEIVL